MLIKQMTVLSFAAAAGLFFSLDAEANSRFTIENQIGEKLEIEIYSGGDQFCKFPEKTKSVSAGKTESYGCTGSGKNLCKIKVIFDDGGSRLCKDLPNACSGKAGKVGNGSKVTVSEERGAYVCDVTLKD